MARLALAGRARIEVSPMPPVLFSTAPIWESGRSIAPVAFGGELLRLAVESLGVQFKEGHAFPGRHGLGVRRILCRNREGVP